jgi:hypothetical protein
VFERLPNGKFAGFLCAQRSDACADNETDIDAVVSAIRVLHTLDELCAPAGGDASGTGHGNGEGEGDSDCTAAISLTQAELDRLSDGFERMVRGRVHRAARACPRLAHVPPRLATHEVQPALLPSGVALSREASRGHCACGAALRATFCRQCLGALRLGT